MIDKMGKNTGFYFIKEIKEDLPVDYEAHLREQGVDLDYLQMEYITERKKQFRMSIQNDEIIKQVFKALFNILERSQSRKYAIQTLRDLIFRFGTEHEVLKNVSINDAVSIQGVDIIVVNSSINTADADKVGKAIQKIFQELNKELGEQGGYKFIENLKSGISFEYLFKIEEMGVNLNVISLGMDLIVKNVLKALIDVLSDVSTQSYAFVIIKNVIGNIGGKYEFLHLIEIDSMKYSEGIEAITIKDDVNNIRPSEIGRGIQKLIESIVKSLGEEAGSDFIDKFKQRLGKAHLVRIEEMGVNLYMIELKQNWVF
jgi:hypothetical protein